MTNSVYIRPLVLEDAQISYNWRNNPKVWELTDKPNKYITPEIETEWLSKVLKRQDEKRFAICTTANNQYVGNIHLSKIKGKQAECSIFIGLPELWHKGIGTQATSLLVEYAFLNLNLEVLCALIDKANMGSLSMFKKVGFETEGELKNIVKVTLSKSAWQYFVSNGVKKNDTRTDVY